MNKYSFVWKKNTIRLDQLNHKKLGEVHETPIIGEIPAGAELTLEMLDTIINKDLVVLNETVAVTKKTFLNPAK